MGYLTRKPFPVLGGILAAWSVCASAIAAVCYDITITSSTPNSSCTSCTMCFPPVYDIVPGKACLAPASQFPQLITCFPATPHSAPPPCWCDTPAYANPINSFWNGVIVCDMACPNGGDPGDGDS